MKHSLRKKIPASELASPVFRQYLKPMTREGAKHGIQREKTETATEYLDTVCEKIPLEKETYRMFLDTYSWARFGETSPEGFTDLNALTVKITGRMRRYVYSSGFLT